MKIIIVVLLIFLVVLPAVIASYRCHFRKRLIVILLSVTFVLSIALLTLEATAEIGIWIGGLGWLALLIMSLTDPVGTGQS